MCFRNLPIVSDPHGKARLKEGLEDPWGVRDAAAERRRRQLDPPAPPSKQQRAVMRAAGSHAFGVVVGHRAAVTRDRTG